MTFDSNKYRRNKQKKKAGRQKMKLPAKLMLIIFLLCAALAFSVARNIQYYNSGCIIEPNGAANVEMLTLEILK